MDMLQARQNDPSVLTHGERDEDGLSLGRQSTERQGLMPAASFSRKQSEKVSFPSACPHYLTARSNTAYLREWRGDPENVDPNRCILWN